MRSINVVFVASLCIPSNPSKVHQKWCTTATSGSVTACRDWVANGDSGCSLCCHNLSKGSWAQIGSKGIYSYFAAQVRIKVTLTHMLNDACRTWAWREMHLDLLNGQSALWLQVSQDVILLQVLAPCITQHTIASAIWHSGWFCGKRDVWFHGRDSGLSQDERDEIKRWIWLLVFSSLLPPHPLLLICFWFKSVPMVMAESFAKLLAALGCGCCCEQ